MGRMSRLNSTVLGRGGGVGAAARVKLAIRTPAGVRRATEKQLGPVIEADSEGSRSNRRFNSFGNGACAVARKNIGDRDPSEYLSSTFAIFRATSMMSIDSKKDSFPCLALPSSSVRKGVRDVVLAQNSPATAFWILYSIYPA